MTFPVRMTDWREVSRRWARFRRRVNKIYGGVAFPGVRVAEWHPGGHGWHLHYLTDVYRRVEAVRAAAEKVGFGRINVVYLGKRPQDMARYLAKHFSKDFRRPGSKSKGQRKWACMGGFQGVRVKDIEVRSTYRDWLRGRLVAMGVRSLGRKEYAILRREWLVGACVVRWPQPSEVLPSRRPF